MRSFLQVARAYSRFGRLLKDYTTLKTKSRAGKLSNSLSLIKEKMATSCSQIKFVDKNDLQWRINQINDTAYQRSNFECAELTYYKQFPFAFR